MAMAKKPLSYIPKEGIYVKFDDLTDECQLLVLAEAKRLFSPFAPFPDAKPELIHIDFVRGLCGSSEPPA